MKYLNTDRQTMSDLSIQDTVYGEQALHSLYLKTDTKKGRQLMLNWIANPLSDIEQIQKRQSAIAWDKLPELPLDEEELDFLEYYLDYREQLSQNSPDLIREFADIIRYSFEFEDMKKIPKQQAKEEVLSYYTIDCYDYLFRQERLGVIRGLLDVVYQLDVLRAAHGVAIERGYCCCPSMTETMHLSVSGFLHPFLPDGQINDWEISEGNIAIFTGSNMAGKSTTLKALTSIIWLAHCGLPIPVKSMVCPVYEGLYTSINLPDSLRDDRSHFLAEVLRIKEVLQQAQSGKHCLVVLDEMFRGTNAQDAFEASVAVNKLLKEYTSCHFLISTHIIEYAKFFESDPSCCFYYMESEISDNQFVCSYKLKTGISESRVGYWLIQKELS